MVNSVFNTIREEGVVYAPEQPGCWQNGYMMKHRYLAQMILGRPIKPEEVAIHKDGNKDNNSVDNIMVFATKGMGIRYHKTKEGLRQREDLVWEFDCMYDNIEKDEIEDFLSNHTINEAMKKYHKSSTQIVSLCKEYNIEIKRHKRRYTDKTTIELIKNNIDKLGVIKTAKLVHMSPAFLYTVMRNNNVKRKNVKHPKYVITENILQQIKDNVNIIGVEETSKLVNIEKSKVYKIIKEYNIDYHRKKKTTKYIVDDNLLKTIQENINKIGVVLTSKLVNVPESSLYKIIKNNNISYHHEKRNLKHIIDDNLLKTIQENINEFGVVKTSKLLDIPESSLYKIMRDNNIYCSRKTVRCNKNPNHFIAKRKDLNEIIEYLKCHSITETSIKFNINLSSLNKFIVKNNISHFISRCSTKSKIENDIIVSKTGTLQEAIKSLEQKYHVILSIDRIHAYNISKNSLRTELILDNSTISEVANKYHVFDEDVEFLSTKYHLDNESIKHKNLAKNVLTKINIDVLTNIGYGIEDIANMYKIGTLYVRYAMIFNK